MDDKQKLEEKIGEALGLEMAAQKAVEEFESKGLLNDHGMKGRLESMKKEANNHQIQIEQLVQSLSKSRELDHSRIQSKANETENKISQMMKIYVGDQADSSEAVEFLCFAEGGEVTHYEILNAMAKKVKDRKFSTRIRTILKEEQRHLKLCTRLAKQSIINE
ncbi:MAG TPA: hypothetical protein VE619_04795 [Nitrososphaeraceae archaeon]|jgi:ferritin-like metal-binding protein YciE|nr:hypothetical protein [Nitrososphaeraceae archaeon]HZC20106.1 hypothetical protein [Nitrososphaeraceae archaeon]